MCKDIVIIIVLIPIAGFICAIIETEIEDWKYRNGKKDKLTYGGFLRELKKKKQEEIGSLPSFLTYSSPNHF